MTEVRHELTLCMYVRQRYILSQFRRNDVIMMHDVDNGRYVGYVCIEVQITKKDNCRMERMSG